jgi:hypothetical protein
MAAVSLSYIALQYSLALRQNVSKHPYLAAETAMTARSVGKPKIRQADGL